MEPLGLFVLKANQDWFAPPASITIHQVLTTIVVIQLLIALVCLIFLMLSRVRLLQKIGWLLGLVAGVLTGWPLTPILFLTFYYFVVRPD